MTTDKSIHDVFRQKMLREGLPHLVVDTFLHYHDQLREGAAGLIRESEIEPVPLGDLADATALDSYRERGRAALANAAVIVLNGGLGTTMGLEGPKCLLDISDNGTLLDLALRKQQAYAAVSGTPSALVFMNSFNTDALTLAALEKSHWRNPHGLPLSFLQHKFPKVLKGSLAPASWSANPALEWNPPGHGNLYAAIKTSGVLDRLLAAGKFYAFVANVDNLGASLDLGLLGHFAASGAPFMMEVIRRTPMDRKGGHLALRDGRLVLRELAQTHPDDVPFFQDVERHFYFNTNNIWLDLRRINKELAAGNGVFDLPLIRNEKTLDPRDPSSPPVFQIETAMGAAIGLFADSSAVTFPLSATVSVPVPE